MGRGGSRRPALGMKSFSTDPDQASHAPSIGAFGASAALAALQPETWNNIPIPLVEGIKTIISELKALQA